MLGAEALENASRMAETFRCISMVPSLAPAPRSLTGGPTLEKEVYTRFGPSSWIPVTKSLTLVPVQSTPLSGYDILRNGSVRYFP